MQRWRRRRVFATNVTLVIDGNHARFARQGLRCNRCRKYENLIHHRHVHGVVVGLFHVYKRKTLTNNARKGQNSTWLHGGGCRTHGHEAALYHVFVKHGDFVRGDLRPWCESGGYRSCLGGLPACRSGNRLMDVSRKAAVPVASGGEALVLRGEVSL